MALKRCTYTRPSAAKCVGLSGPISSPDEYGGRGGVRRRVLGVSLPGAAASADLGGSSKYSIEDLED
jgi:hypothetical protein